MLDTLWLFNYIDTRIRCYVSLVAYSLSVRGVSRNLLYSVTW
jgi:hypothetical protein